MASPASVNPYVASAEFGVGTTMDIIGMMMQLQAMQTANQEAKAIDYRNFTYQKSRDRVGDRFSREQIKMGKEQNRLSRDRFNREKTITNYGIAEQNAQRAVELLNSNNQLRDRVLRNWSI